MTKISRSISFPKEILDEIDLIARRWYSGRSQTIVRIFQEWKQHQPNPQTFLHLRPSNDAQDNNVASLQDITNE